MKEISSYLLSSPLYWIFIIVGLTIIILGTKYLSNILGWFGEHWVKELLGKLDKNTYKVFNDVMFLVDGKTHQIDHIVVSKYGVFVIETKQYNGYIVGDKYDKKWVRYVGKKKYYYTNPIRQNYGHVRCVCRVLGLGEDKVFNVVCIPSKARLKVGHDGELTRYGSLLDKIRGYDKVVIDDVVEICRVVGSRNIVDRKRRRKHALDVKAVAEELDEAMCPRCGAMLVRRNGKYGEFMGCSAYPKCRYVRR